MDAVQVGLTIPGSTFLARGYVGHTQQLVGLVDAALTHVRDKRGFAFLEIISPCTTFNDNYPSWREMLVNLDADESYDRENRTTAIGNYAEQVAAGKLPSGLIYQGDASTFEQATGVSADEPAALQDLTVSKHIDEYRKQMEMYAM